MWRASVFGLLLLVALCACREIVGFDDPDDAARGVEASSAVLLPFVPGPDFKDSCEACARDSCGEARETCLEDGVCRGLFDCSSRCDNPVCFARCGSFATFGGTALFPGDPIGIESLRFGESLGCVYDSCRDACGFGVTWDCLEDDKYRWPQTWSDSLPVQLGIVREGAPYPVAAHVEAFTNADAFLDRGDTGEWGQVELDLSFRTTFYGYFVIVPRIGGLASEIYYPGNLFRPSRGAISVVDASMFVDPDARDAAAMFSISDCLGYRASGVSFEIEGVQAQSSWVLTSFGALTPGETVTSEFGTAGLLGLPPQEHTVYVRATRRGQTLARRPILLRERFVTRVDLYPRGGDDLYPRRGDD